MQEKIFDRIVFGLILIGLTGGVVSILNAGVSSPWFVWSTVLLFTPLLVYALRAAGRFTIAVYVLLLELIGLAAALLLQPGAAGGVAPYLFIPIVIITGLLLSPLAPIVTALVSLLVALGFLASAQSLTRRLLLSLAPPAALTALVALLTAEAGRYLNNLRQISLEKGRLLQQQIHKTEQALEQIRQLQQRVDALDQQLTLARAKTEQLPRLAAQKEQLYRLIAGATQELDASLKSLENILDAIESQSSPAPNAGLLAQAWQKIYHLNKLIAGLEELARLESNQTSLVYRTVDLATLIREVASVADALARDKHLSLRYHLPRHLPPMQADPDRLRQALLYILNNAVAYTDAGAIEIQAEVNGNEVTVNISDTGIGISENETGLVFNAFGRSRAESAIARQGPGLGLAISKRLVEMHGGRMGVSSVPGVGSTFSLTLPLTRPTPPPESTEWPTLAAIDAPTLFSLKPKPAAPANGDSRKITPPVGRRRLSSPVARFSSTYVGRFGLTLLSLLLIIIAVIAFLALRNFSAENTTQVNAVQPQISPTATAIPVSIVTRAAGNAYRFPVAGVVSNLHTHPLPLAHAYFPGAAQPPQNCNNLANRYTFSHTLSYAFASPTPTAPSAEPAAIIPVTPTPVTRWLAYLTGPADQAMIQRRPIGKLQTLEAATPVGLQVIGAGGLAWSARGQIAFVDAPAGDREIFIAAANGGQVTQLTHSPGDDLEPAWSPDGQQLAFSSGRGGNFDIFVMAADGGNLRQLTVSRGFDEWPTWSPDGRRIAFVSDRDGNMGGGWSLPPTGMATGTCILSTRTAAI